MLLTFTIIHSKPKYFWCKNAIAYLVSPNTVALKTNSTATFWQRASSLSFTSPTITMQIPFAICHCLAISMLSIFSNFIKMSIVCFAMKKQFLHSFVQHTPLRMYSASLCHFLLLSRYTMPRILHWSAMSNTQLVANVQLIWHTGLQHDNGCACYSSPSWSKIYAICA